MAELNQSKLLISIATYNEHDNLRPLVESIKNFMPRTPPGREAVAVPSQDTGWIPCVKVKDTEYTGTKVKGIATMHKSNAVPVFSNDEAVEISNMRR